MNSKRSDILEGLFGVEWDLSATLDKTLLRTKRKNVRDGVTRRSWCSPVLLETVCPKSGKHARCQQLSKEHQRREAGRCVIRVRTLALRIKALAWCY